MGIFIASLWILRPRIGGLERAPVTEANTDIHAGIKTALDYFKADTGHYPKGTNGLLELVQQHSGTTNWHGPYLEKLPVDPWGHKYIYENPGKHNTNSYDLFSAGPDGRAGTDDDIGNWMK
ncbi:MAG TPA: type II secretion system major pseudopilin GspG [Candidatus Paceibacterota bacterium]|nr:type II secretion system major pseudopilin GspG [Candidatus Paceibacterota bacterium]